MKNLEEYGYLIAWTILVCVNIGGAFFLLIEDYTKPTFFWTIYFMVALMVDSLIVFSMAMHSNYYKKKWEEQNLEVNYKMVIPEK